MILFYTVIISFNRFVLLRTMNRANRGDKFSIKCGLWVRINPMENMFVTSDYFESMRKC